MRRRHTRCRLGIWPYALSGDLAIWRSGDLAGWYAHSEHTNQLAQEKRNRAAVALQVTETTAAAASAERQIVYKTVYRDVVKYVSKPDRVKCRFDDDAVRMRQRAIDAGNNIAGFDVATMQNK